MGFGRGGVAGPQKKYVLLVCLYRRLDKFGEVGEWLGECIDRSAAKWEMWCPGPANNPHTHFWMCAWHPNYTMIFPVTQNLAEFWVMTSVFFTSYVIHVCFDSTAESVRPAVAAAGCYLNWMKFCLWMNCAAATSSSSACCSVEYDRDCETLNCVGYSQDAAAGARKRCPTSIYLLFYFFCMGVSIFGSRAIQTMATANRKFSK